MEQILDKSKPIFVTGGTGYVGARLIPRLLEAGYKVRAIARNVDKLFSRPWANNPNLEIFPGNIFDLESLKQTMEGCEIAYYLLHSMNSSGAKFAEQDKLAAQNFCKVASVTGLQRVIYLGGLGAENKNLSKHLRSRQEVAQILQNSNLKTTVLRAAMIIGSGSASFEIMRYLVDRLPVMITPKWIETPSQPIAIRNVLTYLVGCLDCRETIGKTFDIGGEEIISYQDLMRIYAEEAGLPPRKIFKLPFFTPWLSSRWIHLVTPLPASIARPLAEGLKNKTICENHEIKQYIPQDLLSCRLAIKLALEKVEKDEVESHWTDAGYSYPPEWAYHGDPQWSGGSIFEDQKKIVLEATTKEIWQPLVKIGGETGWYYGDWLWNLRGVLDKLIGGVGLRRGRRHPSELRSGDALDFWRVVDLQEGKRLLLAAEMKLPGEAVLDFRLKQIDENQVELRQIARYRPRGLTGLLYWWAVTPLHHFVFNGLLKGIAVASGKKIVSGPSSYSE